MSGILQPPISTARTRDLRCLYFSWAYVAASGPENSREWWKDSPDANWHESCLERKTAGLGSALQGLSLSQETEHTTMENKLQMLSVRQKCAHSTHTHHPRRIIMKWIWYMSHLSCRNTACTQVYMHHTDKLVHKDKLTFGSIENHQGRCMPMTFRTLCVNSMASHFVRLVLHSHLRLSSVRMPRWRGMEGFFFLK